MNEDIFNVRWSSDQKSVKLPKGASIKDVLDAARLQMEGLPENPTRIKGYTTGDTFQLSDAAPTGEVIDVS